MQLKFNRQKSLKQSIIQRLLKLIVIIGIFELMLVDDDVRELVLQNVDAGQVKAKAREMGMYTLREDGAMKVANGLTTIAEVTRVTQEDQMELDL